MSEAKHTPGQMRRDPLSVQVVRGRAGVSRWNIMFIGGPWPKRGGKWPSDHPCSDNPEPMVFGPVTNACDDSGLSRFRAHYPDASCFPEGDGICFSASDDTATKAVLDHIQHCFGWQARATGLGGEAR